jgi:hypothetical protein
VVDVTEAVADAGDRFRLNMAMIELFNYNPVQHMNAHPDHHRRTA